MKKAFFLLLFFSTLLFTACEESKEVRDVRETLTSSVWQNSLLGEYDFFSNGDVICEFDNGILYGTYFIHVENDMTTTIPHMNIEWKYFDEKMGAGQEIINSSLALYLLETYDIMNPEEWRDMVFNTEQNRINCFVNNQPVNLNGFFK